MSRYFIGLALPPELSEQLAELKLQLHHENAHSLAPLVPHITLLHPSSLDTSPPEGLLPKVRKITAPYLPLHLRLEVIEAFKHEVLYIKVYSPEIEIIQSKLVQLLPIDKQKIYKKRPFVPHITLLQIHSPAELDLAFLTAQIIQKISLPKVVKINSISCFTQQKPRIYSPIAIQ